MYLPAPAQVGKCHHSPATTVSHSTPAAAAAQPHKVSFADVRTSTCQLRDEGCARRVVVADRHSESVLAAAAMSLVSPLTTILHSFFIYLLVPDLYLL